MSKILVNPNQKGNPALKWLTNTPWEWYKGGATVEGSSSSSSSKATATLQVDYQVGQTIGVLFLG